MKNRILVSTRKGLMIVDRSSGAVVSTHHVGIPVPLAVRNPHTGDLWAALEHGHWGPKLHRSPDGGETWHEVGSPAYPEDAQMPDGSAATLQHIWALSDGGADKPDRLWVGTNPGGLFRSDDGGASFELVSGLWDHPSRGGWFGGGRDTPGIHSIVVDPRDSRHVYVGISCAGVFETVDDGQTWHPRNKGLRADFLVDPHAEVGQDPHLVAVCAAHPDALWQQNHCGIWRSDDGAATWVEVSQEDGPANFGFAIAVDAQRPGTAWVVPAISDGLRMAIDGALVVCRTEDGGATWQELREGLPQESAWDLIYRHALDIDGEGLAFGSTTGNLYATENRGDAWKALAHNLPPIYAVRYA